jgi:hypothetical protein
MDTTRGKGKTSFFSGMNLAAEIGGLRILTSLLFTLLESLEILALAEGMTMFPATHAERDLIVFIFRMNILAILGMSSNDVLAACSKMTLHGFFCVEKKNLNFDFGKRLRADVSNFF